MPLDSESRWRLVRRLKASGETAPEGEIVIRKGTVDDLSQVCEIYNYYVRNSVVTFDLEPLTLEDWRSVKLHEAYGFKHQGHLGKVGFKFGRWLGTVLMQKSL